MSIPKIDNDGTSSITPTKSINLEDPFLIAEDDNEFYAIFKNIYGNIYKKIQSYSHLRAKNVTSSIWKDLITTIKSELLSLIEPSEKLFEYHELMEKKCEEQRVEMKQFKMETEKLKDNIQYLYKELDNLRKNKKSTKKEIKCIQVSQDQTDKMQQTESTTTEDLTTPSRNKMPTMLHPQMTPTIKEEEKVLIIDTLQDNGAKTLKDTIKLHGSSIIKKPLADFIQQRPNRVILKAYSNQDLQQIYDNLKEHPLTRTIGNVRINKTLKNRLIIFGITEEIEEEKLKTEIKKNPELLNREIEVHKIFVTKRGHFNAIINTDNYTAEILLKRGKILIEYERVNISKYIELKICKNCQCYGHVAFKCAKKTICAICSENHKTTECTTQKSPTCLHCHTTNNTHRSDSYHCPVYLRAKHELIKNQRNSSKTPY